ncbi:MAG: TonB family protein [Azoarcus sp.]|jgi:protein TonB|nr:TonB family protein [Azoarcus sp.]
MAMTLSLPFSMDDMTDPRNRWLHVGIVSSVLIHALVLAVQFTFPYTTPTRAPSLAVVLVNAKSEKAPTEAQVLAQANLDGGGNSDKDEYATTPMPAQSDTQTGNDLVDLQRGQNNPAREQQEVLTAERGDIAVAKLEDADKANKPKPSATNDDRDAKAEMSRLQAAIAEKSSNYAKRPRRDNNKGVRAKEFAFALYYDQWKTRTERIGELNYPATARGRTYGSLIMTVSVNKDGTIEKIVVDRPSKYKVLNEAAVLIAQRAAPYGKFPAGMSGVDVYDITSTWTFTNDRLTTKPTER